MPVINVDGKIAALVASISRAATVVVEQKLLCLSPATDRASARTTILESNRVDDLSASPEASRPSGEYLIFARYLKHTRFVLLSYYMHPY